MRRLLLIAALGLLAGCGANAQNEAAVSVAATYIGAAAAVSAYNALPDANQSTVAALRGCDNGAYAAVKPISDALIAHTSPQAAALANAQAAVASMTSCISSFGVKL